MAMFTKANGKTIRGTAMEFLRNPKMISMKETSFKIKDRAKEERCMKMEISMRGTGSTI
jgi:hypothetical protein